MLLLKQTTFFIEFIHEILTTMTKYLKQNIMKAKLKVINFFCMVVINLNLFMISLSYIKFGGSLDYIISFVFKQTKK